MKLYSKNETKIIKPVLMNVFESFIQPIHSTDSFKIEYIFRLYERVIESLTRWNRFARRLTTVLPCLHLKLFSYLCVLSCRCVYITVSFPPSHSFLPTKIGVLLGGYLGEFNFMAKFKGHGKKSD